MPTDTSPLPSSLKVTLVRLMLPLSEAEGVDATLAFLEAQTPRLRDTDPAIAAALDGIAAGLRGDDAAALEADRQLQTLPPSDYPHWELRAYVAAALRDGRTVVDLIRENESLESQLVEWRYEIEYGAHMAGVRDDPAIRAFVDGLPPYVPLAPFLDPGGG